MAQLFKNNAQADLNVSINDTDLTIDITAPADLIDNFPTPGDIGVGDFFLVTLSDASLGVFANFETKWEICRITGVTVIGPTNIQLTVEAGGRGQENTTALSWTAGSTLVSMRFTANSFQGVQGALTLLNEGAAVPGSPHTVLDFRGTPVEVSDQGGGEARVTIQATGGGGAGTFNPDCILTDGMQVLVDSEGHVLTNDQCGIGGDVFDPDQILTDGMQVLVNSEGNVLITETA